MYCQSQWVNTLCSISGQENSVFLHFNHCALLLMLMLAFYCVNVYENVLLGGAGVPQQ